MAALLLLIPVLVGLQILLPAARHIGTASAESEAPGAVLTQTAVPTPKPGECVAIGEKTASERVSLGDRAAITLTARITCTEEVFPLHVLFVLETSSAFGRRDLERVKLSSARIVTECLSLEDNPETKVGIVEFNARARTLTGLTNDEESVLRALGRTRIQEGRAIDRGIEEALRLLAKGRSGSEASEIHEVMLVFTDGHNGEGCDAVLKAARQAKNMGVLLITVCASSSPDCDAECLRRAATSPRYYYASLEVLNSTVCRLIALIREPLRGIELRRLAVKDTLPENMRYVPDSADPPLKWISSDSSQLLWQTNFVPRDGVTYTLEVMPLEAGTHPTNLDARGIFTRNARSQIFTFPVPFVEVVGSPATTASPSASPSTPPSATWTPGASLTPPSTATPPGPPTPTEPARRLYLPIAYAAFDGSGLF